MGASQDITRRKVKRFTGIGDTGSDIFLREVQDTWTWLRPYFDAHAVVAATRLGLPKDRAKRQQRFERVRGE